MLRHLRQQPIPGFLLRHPNAANPQMTLVNLVGAARSHLWRQSTGGATKGGGGTAWRQPTAGCAPTLPFLVASLFCITHYFWASGNQIHCWLEHQDLNEHWVHFVNDFCYVHGMYFVPPDRAEPWRAADKKKIDYYQWVPYLFAIQALLLYLPEFIWKRILSSKLCGIDLYDLCLQTHAIWQRSSSRVDFSEKDHDKSDVHAQPDIAACYLQYLRALRAKSAFISGSMLLAGCLLSAAMSKFVASVVVWLLLQILTGDSPTYLSLGLTTQYSANKGLRLSEGSFYDYYTWGWRVISELESGLDWQITGRFPRIAYCEHVRYRFGAPPVGLIQCTLPMMVYYEKIVIFLWFWSWGLVHWQFAGLVYQFAQLLVPKIRSGFLKAHLFTAFDPPAKSAIWKRTNSETNPIPMTDNGKRQKTIIRAYLPVEYKGSQQPRHYNMELLHILATSLSLDGVLLLQCMSRQRLGTLPMSALVAALAAHVLRYCDTCGDQLGDSPADRDRVIVNTRILEEHEVPGGSTDVASRLRQRLFTSKTGHGDSNTFTV